MVFVNETHKAGVLSKKSFQSFLTLLSLYAPNLSNSLWEEQGFSGTIDDATYPEYDENLTKTATCSLAVQVNGKLRGVIQLSDANISEADALSLVRLREDIEKHIGGKTIKRVVYLAGKILNIVV